MTARAQKMPAARQVLDKAMDEDDLLTAIVEAALLMGYQVFHVRRSDKALTMGTPGFPDVVLSRAGVTLFLELKSQTGRLNPDQLAWAQAIGAAHHRVVRPSDLDETLALLADLR